LLFPCRIPFFIKIIVSSQVKEVNKESSLCEYDIIFSGKDVLSDFFRVSTSKNKIRVKIVERLVDLGIAFSCANLKEQMSVRLKTVQIINVLVL